jgi:hypothetical protein
MNQSLIIESVLKYLDNENIDTSIEDDKLVDLELLQIIENAQKSKSHYKIIFSIYAFLSFHLYHSSFSIEKVFPTLNKFFEMNNLAPILIKYEKKTLEYKASESYDSTRIKQSVELIKRLSREFEFTNLKIDNDFFDKFVEQIKVDSTTNQKTLQQFDAAKYEEYLYKLLFYMIDLLEKRNYSKFYKMIGLFLVTATMFYGNDTFSIKAMFQFFNIVEKYSKIEKLPIGSIIASIKKMYVSAFFLYKNTIRNSKDLEKLEIVMSIENAKLTATNLADINERTLKILGDAYKVQGFLWFSPMNRKNEWMFGAKETEMNRELENFLMQTNEDVFNRNYFESHSLKLMLMTRTLYNIARKSFIEDKSWIKNPHIEEAILISEEFIGSMMNANHSSLLDQRLLSFISAKNAIKEKYNLYNNKWDNLSLVETHLTELSHIINRKHYLIDAATCGKVIEEICKIQDYLNLHNIYISLEKEYLEQMKNLETMAVVQSMNICNNFSISDITTPYDIKQENRLDFYDVRQTRTSYNYELGNHFLSAMKFLGPSIVWNSRSENNVKRSIDFVNGYWNFFNKHYGLNKEEVDTIKNSNFAEHV